MENDLISRQAAIDGFYEMASDMDYLCTVSDYVSFLESLPSAQPYTDAEIQKIQGIEQAQFDKIRELAYQDGKADAMAKIIHCKDCYYRYGRYCHYRYTNGLFISADHYCGFAKRQEDDRMKDDTISRQAVLKLLSAMPPEDAMTKAMLIQSVKQMDAAQPERKRGNWKPYRCDMYECSKCGYIYTELTDRHKCGANFCPHCGADMRGEQDG